MKINFACGRQVLDGFYNIDAVRSELAPRDPELLFELQFADGDLVQKVPLADGCADELHAMHIIEHFYRYDVDAVVEEWKRLLRKGGSLILELPNLEAAAANFLRGARDQMCMWAFYGDPGCKSPYMVHRWGYSPASITALLSEHGFAKIKILPPQTHRRRADRDMRVEAVKP